MSLDDKARDTFEIISRAFDNVEADLKSVHELGEMDEKEYAMSLATLLKQRLQKLCEEVPGFRKEFETALQSEQGQEAITEMLKAKVRRGT